MYSLQAGRLICFKGKPLFTVQRKDDMPIADADLMAHKLVRLLNADNYYLVIDPSATCLRKIEEKDRPIACARCGGSEVPGECYGRTD